MVVIDISGGRAEDLRANYCLLSERGLQARLMYECGGAFWVISDDSSSTVGLEQLCFDERMPRKRL